MKTITMDYETYLKEKSEEKNEGFTQGTKHGLWLASKVIKNDDTYFSNATRESAEYKFLVEEICALRERIKRAEIQE